MVYFKEIRNTISKFSQQTVSGSSWTNTVSFLQGSDPIIIMCMHAQSLQSCPTLCESMVYSPPGFLVHGILQLRTLEWVTMPSSRGSFQPRN